MPRTFTTMTTYRRVDGSGWTYNMVDLDTGECIAFDGGYPSQPIAAAAAVRRHEEILNERKKG